MILLIIMALINPVNAAEPEFDILAPAAYARLDSKSQSDYINKIRKSWMEFEHKYSLPIEENAFLKNLIIDTAHADQKFCVIGGNTLPAVLGNHGRYVCPTRTRGCAGQKDGFQCGAIFGEACISRLPISNISERCYKNSSAAVDEKSYKNILSTMAKDLETVCTNTSKPSDGCKFLAKKISEATSEAVAKVDAIDRGVAAATTATEIDTTPDFIDMEVPVASVTAKERREKATAKADACSKGKKSQGQAIVPAFDLISGNTCVFENNQKNLSSLTSKGCSKKGSKVNLLATEFKSKSGLIYGRSNKFSAVITDSDLIEKKSATEATYSVRMLVYDISKDPPKLQQVTNKIHQKGTQYTLYNSYGIPTEITIKNKPRSSFVLSDTKGLKTMIDAAVRMTDDCLFSQDVSTLQASGTPASDTSSGGR